MRCRHCPASWQVDSFRRWTQSSLNLKKRPVAQTQIMPKQNEREKRAHPISLTKLTGMPAPRVRNLAASVTVRRGLNLLRHTRWMRVAAKTGFEILIDEPKAVLKATVSGLLVLGGIVMSPSVFRWLLFTLVLFSSNLSLQLYFRQAIIPLFYFQPSYFFFIFLI